jgi:hypothetical protein
MRFSGVDVDSSTLLEEGWPGVPADVVWPSPSVGDSLCTHGWPSVEGGVEVAIKVCSDTVELQRDHSACRSLMIIGCLSLTYLAPYVTTPSVLPLEVVPPVVVPVEELNKSLPSESMLPEAISEALGISPSDVFDLYFRDVDEVVRDHLIWEAIDRHRDDLQERSQFKENTRREREAEHRAYREDSMF